MKVYKESGVDSTNNVPIAYKEKQKEETKCLHLWP